MIHLFAPPLSRAALFLGRPLCRSCHCPSNLKNPVITSRQRQRLREPNLIRLAQRRTYAQTTAGAANKSAPEPLQTKAEQLKRHAQVAAKNASSKKTELPERLLIYHAGTGRMTFLAMVKATSVLIGAFFCFVGVPGYIKADKPLAETAGVALCGIAPIIFIAYTTAPFATHVHIHLPARARASRAALERFVRSSSVLSDASLTLTTMSFIAKPRYSTLPAAALLPARRRLGIVNYIRDPADALRENATRKWYMYRAVTQFCVQQPQAPSGRTARYQTTKKTKTLVEGWIWDVVREKIAARETGEAARLVTK